MGGATNGFPFCFILTNDTVLRDEILDELLCVCNDAGHQRTHSRSDMVANPSVGSAGRLSKHPTYSYRYFFNLFLSDFNFAAEKKKIGFLCAHPVFPSDGVVRRRYCKNKGKQKKRKKKKEKFEYVGVFIRNPPFFTLPH